MIHDFWFLKERCQSRPVRAVLRTGVIDTTLKTNCFYSNIVNLGCCLLNCDRPIECFAFTSHHSLFKSFPVFQLPLIVPALAGSIGVFFLTKGEPKRKFWLFGAGALAFVFPLTGASINPKYRHPMCNEPEALATKGPDHVQRMFDRWSFQHGLRSSAGSLAFIIFLGALL